MAAAIKFKRATVEDWQTLNPILQSGEPGFVYGTNKLKIGDGNTPWNELPFTNDAYSKNEADSKFVVKEEGKSLISNDEIARLAEVNNYDDTEIRSLIKDNSDAIDTKLADYAKTADVNTKLDKKADKTQVATDIAKAIAPLATTEALNDVKATAQAATTVEEVNAQIDTKIGALNLGTAYEPIGAEDRAKAYVDGKFTDANLAQYTTEQEVKDIVDGVIAGAADSETYNSLTKLVDYIDTHGGQASEMAQAIETLEGDVKGLKEAPSAGIKATDIEAWNGEIGAKALAETKTTPAEVKTQIESYGYATTGYADEKASAAKDAAIADAAGKYETIGIAQGIVDGLKLDETYQPIGAESRAIAAAKTETEKQVKALAEAVPSALAQGEGESALVGNDLATNKAVGTNAVAFGSDTIAGQCAFKVSHVVDCTKDITTEVLNGHTYCYKFYVQMSAEDVEKFTANQKISFSYTASGYNGWWYVAVDNGTLVTVSPSTAGCYCFDIITNTLWYEDAVAPDAESLNTAHRLYDVRQPHLGTDVLTSCSHASGNKTIAAGNASHAEGSGTIAASQYSHAEGLGTAASGQNAHAEGKNSIASGGTSHAEGHTAVASGRYSHAEGARTTASGEASHAEGNWTTASGSMSHAEGKDCKALGHRSHAEGSGTTAGGNGEAGDGAHSEGIGTTASGKASHAEGSGSAASGSSSHAEGGNTNAKGGYSHVEGAETQTTAAASYAHAEGYDTTAAASAAHAEGTKTQATSSAAHAEGIEAIASGSAAHAEGGYTQATGDYAHAEGSGSVATAVTSHAEGSHSSAKGVSSHAQGSSCKALGHRSHAQGDETTAGGNADGTGGGDTGNGAHAEGKKTTASAIASHAEGQETTASGIWAHAEGYNAKATLNAAHAEGGYTQATGNYAHAEGYYSVAAASYSHVEGQSTRAAVGATASHAEGRSTTTNAEAQHVQGRFNKADSNMAHIVGNGTSDTDRKNIHTLDWDGNAWYAGEIRVGGSSYDTGSTLATTQQVEAGLAVKLDSKAQSLTGMWFYGIEGNKDVAKRGVTSPSAWNVPLYATNGVLYTNDPTLATSSEKEKACANVGYVDGKVSELEQGIMNALGSQYTTVTVKDFGAAISIPSSTMRFVYIESLGVIKGCDNNGNELGVADVQAITVGDTEYSIDDLPKYIEIPEGMQFINLSIRPPEGTIYTKGVGGKIVLQVRTG